MNNWKENYGRGYKPSLVKDRIIPKKVHITEEEYIGVNNFDSLPSDTFDAMSEQLPHDHWRLKPLGKDRETGKGLGWFVSWYYFTIESGKNTLPEKSFIGKTPSEALRLCKTALDNKEIFYCES